jgi:hypothetical protein
VLKWIQSSESWSVWNPSCALSTNHLIQSLLFPPSLSKSICRSETLMMLAVQLATAWPCSVYQALVLWQPCYTDRVLLQTRYNQTRCVPGRRFGKFAKIWIASESPGSQTSRSHWFPWVSPSQQLQYRTASWNWMH